MYNNYASDTQRYAMAVTNTHQRKEGRTTHTNNGQPNLTLIHLKAKAYLHHSYASLSLQTQARADQLRFHNKYKRSDDFTSENKQSKDVKHNRAA